MCASGLDDEDRKLWSLVTRQVEPLKSTEQRMKDEARKAAIEAAARAAQPAGKVAGRKTPKKPGRPAAVRTALPPAAPVAPDVRGTEAGRGRVAGLDRRTAERLRKGQYPVEARLDLHGMNQEQAHRALALFVRQCHAAGKRCVLVITGKGGRQRPSADGPYVNPEPAGVLRRKAPEWLRQADLAPLVLSIAGATPAHGGAGAFYVLLKRRRES